MLTFKSASRKTYDRNIKSGKWIAASTPTDSHGLIRTAQKTRGVHNSAGRVYLVEFTPERT